MFIDVTRYCKHVFSKKTMYMVNSHYDFINTSLQKKKNTVPNVFRFLLNFI